MWPFKQLLLRGGANSAAKYAFPCRHLHHFGDMQALRSSLHLTNLLTGCVQSTCQQAAAACRGPSDRVARAQLGGAAVPSMRRIGACSCPLLWRLHLKGTQQLHRCLHFIALIIIPHFKLRLPDTSAAAAGTFSLSIHEGG
jgi:hypothetical protein